MSIWPPGPPRGFWARAPTCVIMDKILAGGREHLCAAITGLPRLRRAGRVSPTTAARFRSRSRSINYYFCSHNSPRVLLAERSVCTASVCVGQINAGVLSERSCRNKHVCVS